MLYRSIDPLCCKPWNENLLIASKSHVNCSFGIPQLDQSRNYQVLGHLRLQDNWAVEIRERQKGKGAGDFYKVYTAPGGKQIYTFKGAKHAGFKDPEKKVDALFKKLKQAKDKK